MAASRAFITMGELLEESAETEQEDKILDRLKLVAQETLPDGWLDWKTVIIPKDELFGSKEVIDPQILNKIRFALPTVGIAKSFNPSTTDLPEKQYRDYKVRMLNWTFCRALIISPPSIVNKLKGSVDNAESFQEEIQHLKHLFVSRKKAVRTLRREMGLSESEEEEISQRKRGSTSRENTPVNKRPRIELLEEKMNNMSAALCGKIEELKNTKNRPESNAADASDKENDYDSDTSESLLSEHASQDSLLWTAPEMEHPKNLQNFDLEAFSLDAQTKEKEPSIPLPAPAIKAQGLACQKLGTSGWNRIRYKEVQKKLHAAPLFDTLKVNGELKGLEQKSFSQTILGKMDEMAGIITHGLLKERASITEGMKILAQKHPEAYNDIKDIFFGDSSFKEISDDLLHFTCARRSEIIDMRRRIFFSQYGTNSTA